MELPQLNRASLESPYAQELERGFQMLRFAGPLEKEFRDFFIGQNRLRGRLSALSALVLIVAASAIEAAFTDYPGRNTAILLRLFVGAPALGCLVLATYLQSLNRYFELIVSVCVVAIGVSIIYISHQAALAGSSYHLAGVVLAILYACLFMGLQFYLAVGLTVFLISLHVAAGTIIGLAPDVLLYTTAMCTAATVIGAISTYFFEHALRTSFLETRLLNELAQRDGLTGIYNRRIFDDYMKRLWRQSRRDRKMVEILMIDIDSFKIYNDLYGHQAGDDCLRAVAQTISRAAR